MSTFLEKSNQSLESANLLAKEKLYSSTVNRAYYASLQFVLHILIKTGDDKDEIANQCKLEKKGTHIIVLNRIKRKVYKLRKYDTQYFKWFQNALPELKEDRNIADYTDNVLVLEDAHNSIEKAKSIIEFLNVTFE
ncbi:MAG TPA: HEPN domain-containing protein [Ferruginibacter sp.]|jgi:uncharacterized protein (UPF0332 family)|nr:HEPN domain-containing protein [Ferruginibacter sp.]